MSNKTLLIPASVLVAVVALAVAIMVGAQQPTTTVPFTGSDGSLRLLSVEAQRCGIARTKVERIGKFLALSVETTGPDDQGFECLIKWVNAHPEAKIGFLGNEASSSQSKR